MKRIGMLQAALVAQIVAVAPGTAAPAPGCGLGARRSAR